MFICHARACAVLIAMDGLFQVRKLFKEADPTQSYNDTTKLMQVCTSKMTSWLVSNQVRLLR